MSSAVIRTLFTFLATLVITTPSYAWTLRGHQIICETATFLVQEEELKDFLKARGLSMAHLCNVPDTQWKEPTQKNLSKGNASHYLGSEFFDDDPGKIGLHFSKLVQTFLAKNPQYQPGSQLDMLLGSNWWRADQFFRRAIKLKTDFATAPLPRTHQEAQNEDFPFSKAVYDFMLNLGLMGHFVGDNSQPFHMTKDLDGHNTGHGGIHLHYEHSAVVAQPVELFDEVFKRAKTLKSEKWLRKGNVLERMRELGKLSYSDKDAVLKWDSPRQDAKASAASAKPLLTEHLARGAALLAQLWDEAFVQVGRPPLKVYKGYRFPTFVEFVDPDYYP